MMPKLFAPYVVFVCYNLMTYILFIFGPFNWKISNQFDMSLFLISCLFLYTIGYMLGIRLKPGSVAKTEWISKRLPIFILISIFMYIMATYFYTGNFFWNFTKLFSSQSQNYQDTLAYVKNNRASRIPFVALKVLLQPVLYISLVYLTINFSKLSNINKIGVALIYSFWIIFSVFRGTDKELFDIIAIILTSIAINSYHQQIKSGRSPSGKKIVRLFFLQLTTILMIVGFLSIFSTRKQERMGGSQAICFQEIGVCSKYSNTSNSNIFNFTYSVITAYTSQGYYGLSLAIDSDFNSTFPVGAWPALTELGPIIYGANFSKRSLIQQVSHKGWDDKIRWSTAYTWWASDISLLLVPFIMMLIGLTTALSWKESITSMSLYSICVFSLMTTITIFLSSNNQVGISLDSMFSFFVVLFVWLRHHGKSLPRYS